MEIRKHQLEPIPRQIHGFENQDDIYISIEIGNGQIGGSKVTSGDLTLAKGKLTEPTLIGVASNLKDNEVEIETNILDVNTFTNMCVLTTTFYNQEKKVLFTTIDKGEAPESGIASFTGRYLFNVLLFLFYFVSGTEGLTAQNASDNVSFQNLETPSSPGLILLDNAPSSIERPTTPQGFGFSALGFIQGTGSAIEFAPFWLTLHPKLTAEKMYKTKFPILYNFSISAATVQPDSTYFLAGGFRTRFFQSYTKDCTAKLDSIKSLMEDALVELDTTLLKVLQKNYSEIIENPVFTIDFAASVSGGSVSNSFDDLKLSRWAFWLSCNYRPSGSNFYMTALSRYIRNENYRDYSANSGLIDLGTRLNYDISKLCISIEYLQRLIKAENKVNDFRIAVIGSYKLSDNFFITSTFGKNFSDVNNIIALAGVNFGYSRSKIKAF